VIESPELARSLYKFVPIGAMAPAPLHDALVVIFKYIQTLEGMSLKEQRQKTKKIEKLKVPQGMRFEG
jgi:flagellar biosynthesis protein FlhB